MTIVEILILLIIAAICGSVGQAIVGYSAGGFLIKTGVGLIGAIVGKWLASEFGFSYLLPLSLGGRLFPIVWAIIGSTLFVAIVGLLSRK